MTSCVLCWLLYLPNNIDPFFTVESLYLFTSPSFFIIFAAIIKKIIKSFNMYKFSSLVAFLLFLSFTYTAQSQVFEDDFEGSGTITDWFGDDCGMDTNFANPFAQGDNTSATVLEYNDNGGQYANVRFQQATNFDLTTNNTFSLKIYVPSSGLTGGQDNKVSLKLQNGDIEETWTTQTEIIKPIILNEWQTVTFDFQNDNFNNLDATSPPPVERTDLNRVVIQINGENNEDFVLAYLDDVAHFNTIYEAPVFDNLVWSDEFDEDGEINDLNWHHQTLLPPGGSWYNNEIQHYTDRVENSFVEDGILKVNAIKENFTDQGVTKQYTSARLNSKFAFTYGRVEFRAKLPFGVGTWPALWMLGKNINEDGAYWDNEGFDTSSWPACGEIDIMEHWGNNQNYVSSATHTPSSSGATINNGGQVIPSVSTDFHIYALEWTSEKLVFSVDGAVHFTYNPPVKNNETWPFDAEQYLLLNVAILPEIFADFTEDAMEVDYVRVYQESSTATNEADDYQQTPVFYPNPVEDVLTIELEEMTNQDIVFNIYNTLGNLVKTETIVTTDARVGLNGFGTFASGVYFISYELNGRKYEFKVYKK
jgi:beta-glucanase (GH16 family)